MKDLNSTNYKFDFLSKRYIAYVISLLLIILSVYTWIDRGASKYGIDYAGGHEFVVKVTADTNVAELRRVLSKAGLDSVVQAFDSEDGEYSLRLADTRTSVEVRKSISKALEDTYPERFEILKADYVGPAIGDELKRNALIAMVVSLIGILFYISYRFELSFAVGAVAALFHDVVIALGLYLFSGMTIGMATLAAGLTVIGYSINDTIIIFDRIREEITKRKEYDLQHLVNYCINKTLTRTILTSLTTLFSAAALYFYGGGAIAELSLFLCIGIIVGTYSTIFIATPVAMAWENMRAKVEPLSN